MNDSRIYFGDKLKALDDDGRVGGYLVRFTDAENKDLDGEYFTPETYLGPKDGDGVDTYFHHAVKLKLPDKVDPEIKAEVDALSEYQFAPVKTKRDAIGIFAEVVLDMAKRYEEVVYGLVKQGKLGWSSGAIDHLVRVNSDGRIKRWPIGEASLTPTPCEPQNHAIPIKSLSTMDFTMFGKSAKGLLADEMAETTPSFWQVESAFCRVIKKIGEGAKNSDITGEFDWRAKVNQAGTELGSEAASLATSQIESYLESTDDEFYLKGITESESFESFEAAGTELQKFAQKMRSNHEIRVKEGRMLSASNRAKVQACRDSMTALMTDLDELLAISEPKPKEKSDVAALRTQSLQLEGQVLHTLARTLGDSYA